MGITLYLIPMVSQYRRRSLHLDDADWAALVRLAEAERKASGVHITAGELIRRAVRAYLRKVDRAKRQQRRT